MTIGLEIIVAKVESLWVSFLNEYEKFLEKTDNFKEEGAKKLKTLTKALKIAGSIEIILLIATLISVFTGNDMVRFATAVISLIGIIVLTNLSSVLKGLLIFLAGLVPLEDKKKKYEQGLKELDVSLTKVINFVNYIGMALIVIASWAAVFGPYEISEIGNLQIPVMIVAFSIFLMSFIKKENPLPRIVMTVGMIIISFYWFQQQDNEISRRAAALVNSNNLEIGDNTDNKNSALVKITCSGYSQNFDSVKTIDAFTIVRLTTETKRYKNNLYTRMMTTNGFGNFDEGKSCWVLSGNLERGMEFYPATEQAEYAVKRQSVGLFKKIVTVYSLTDGPMTISNLPLKKFQISGVNAGEVLMDDYRSTDGKMGEASINHPCLNTVPTRILQCEKGKTILLTFF